MSSVLVIGIVLAGMIVWYAIAPHLSVSKREVVRPVTVVRMVGVVAWIAIVCTGYVTAIVDRLDEESCFRVLNSRTETRDDYEDQLELLDDQIDTLENTPPFDVSVVPGYGEYADEAVGRTVDYLAMATVEGRKADLERLVEEYDALQTEADEYAENFPLPSC